MLTDLEPYTTAWATLSLIILVAMIPAVLFILGRAASAGAHPDADQMEEVRKLAIQLDEISDHLLNEATRAYTSAPGEKKALDALLRFTETAENYRNLVLGPLRTPALTRRGYQQLALGFEVAQSAFPALRAYGNGRERFEQIRRVMKELRFYYETQALVKDESTYRAPKPGLEPLKRPPRHPEI